jgi:hypothetical protein
MGTEEFLETHHHGIFSRESKDSTQRRKDAKKDKNE